MQGQIIKALAGFYYVESDGQVYQTRARGNFRKKGHTPYVGDWVDFSAEENSEGYILKIHERNKTFRHLWRQGNLRHQQNGCLALVQGPLDDL